MPYTVPNPFELDLTREFLLENSFAPLVAGDTVVWRFQARDEEDAAINLTGATVRVDIYTNDSSTTVLHTRAGVLDGEQFLEMGNTGAGWFSAVWVPADLEALTAIVGRKFYRIVITFSSGAVRSFCTGRIDILRAH